MSTVVLLACGDDDGVVDAGRDGDDGSECSVDDECSDGQFCNGPETCEAGRCVAGSPPCSSDMCDEATDMCADCEDRDGDGALDAACGGTDCDDNDRNRFPGNTEVCDVDGVDEDCEPRTFGFLDVDGDGEADAACCNMDGATQRCGTDCDDIRADVNTTSVEACDGRDNDCDGTVDEGVLTTYYRDDDGDGFGLAESTTEACEVPADFAVLPGDCDDDNGGRNPGLSERCVGMIDEDCDGTVDEMCDCVVGEPPRDCPLPGACAAGNESCESGRWGECSISPEVNAAGEPEESVCDLIDSDCDGRTDEGLQIGCFADDDRDGYALSDAAMTMACTCPLGTTNRRPVVGAIDCDDENPNANPGQTEVCNTVDADCDGSIDEGLQVTCYTDSDRDGFAPAGATVTMACACPLGTTDRRPDGADIDCNDDDASIRPGAPELCDRIDSDCSVGGAVEIGEDADNDGFARSTAACTGGFPKTDCNDEDDRVFPGQRAFFTSGRCPGHRAFVDCGFAVRCGDCFGPIFVPVFDYDCNTISEPQPAVSCRPAIGASCGFGGCIGAGSAVPHSSDQCGEEVPWRDCMCPGAGACNTVVVSDQRLGCR